MRRMQKRQIELEEKLKEQETQNKSLYDKYNNVKKQYVSVKEQMFRIESEKEATVSDYTTLQRQSTTTLNQTEKKVKDLETQLKEAKRKVESLSTDKTLYKNRMKGLQEKVANKEQEIVRIAKEKEECSTLYQAAQLREKKLSERLGEESYLRSLIDQIESNNASANASKNDVDLDKSNIQSAT